MKKFWSVLFLCFAAIPAFADNNAAFVYFIDIPNENCAIPDGEGGVLFASDGKFIQTQSANGNMMLSCRVQDAAFAPSDGETVFVEGFQCNAITMDGTLVHTFDSRVVISPGGAAHLKCFFRAE